MESGRLWDRPSVQLMVGAKVGRGRSMGCMVETLQGGGKDTGSHEAVGPAFEVADGRVVRVSRGGMLCSLNCL